MEFCVIVKGMGKEMWTCKKCELKNSDMKTVIESMNSIKSELSTIKDGQAEQQTERARVLEGLKSVEAVVKRMDSIEKTQTDQGERLLEQEVKTGKNAEKIEETARKTEAIEKRLAGMEGETVGVKVTNAVVRELREMEKNDRNLIIANIPESSAEEAEARKKEDEDKVCAVFSELNHGGIKPANVIRIGFGGRYPKKILVIFRTEEEKDKILHSAENTTLTNDVWLARSRTWNQREEARLFREEKRKEEEEGVVTQNGRPRGRAPGRPKKNGNGSLRGRGSQQERKRRMSGEEDEAKWRRTGENGRGRGTSKGGAAGRGGALGRGVSAGRGGAAGRGGLAVRGGGGGGVPSTSTPPPPMNGLGTPEAVQKTADRPATPHPSRSSMLEAAEENF